MSSKAQSAPKSLVIISSAMVLVWIVLAAFPFFWTLWGSFKVQGDFFSKADWRYALTGTRTIIETGGSFTNNGYEGAWIQEAFWRNAFNTLIVVFFTVVISLTFGTLGGYALARSGHSYAFWLLMIALVFRAMPHITLVSGYLLPFFEWNLWGHLPTTIIVLVAINQPFTLWMLHSFFLNIPKDLDESAKVDGCTQFQAFRLVIIPVMWPGVITTGLFSFLLAYNDFAVTTMLLLAHAVGGWAQMCRGIAFANRSQSSSAMCACDYSQDFSRDLRSVWGSLMAALGGDIPSPSKRLPTI